MMRLRYVLFVFGCLGLAAIGQAAVPVQTAPGFGLRHTVRPIPGVPIAGTPQVRRAVTGLKPGRLVLPAHTARAAAPAPSAGTATDPAQDGWMTVKSENFEGTFPNDWALYGDPTWDDETYRKHAGSKSGYCVGSSVTPPGPYPSDANSWMVYGPFSLVGATDARLDFYRWMITEEDYDYLFWGASIQGDTFYGYRVSGDSQTWRSQYFDLRNVPTLGNLCGRSQVWIAFAFSADFSNEYEGAYVDDAVLQKYTAGGDQPDLTYCQPAGWDFPIVPANVTGTHTVPSPLNPGTTYIDWAGTNIGTAATSDTFFVYLYLDNTPIAGWHMASAVAPGDTYYVEDYQTSIAAGNHTLMTMQDSTRRIAESDENNNRYSHSWTWGGGGPAVYEHVTITSNALSASFAPLKPFLLGHLGLHDTVVTTENIYASQSGRDNPEKIRNFTKWAYQNWQTRYALLGGDAEVVPQRMAYPGMVTGGARWYDTIPADLYYSCLDNTWDGNGNNVFGEMGDNVDMGPEVYVGRAPVSNATEASRFVTKTSTYGGSGSPHRQRVLLTGFDLDASTYGENTMEYFDENYIYAPFTCWKVYDSYSGNHHDATRDYLNQGCHYFIHADHGNTTILGTGANNHGWALDNSDMSGLTNGFDKLAVLMTSACLVGAFDRGDGVMEAFMNAANGGGVLAMCNSRYGWYAPYQNPQLSYSGAFVQNFVDRLFAHGTNPGAARDFLLAKADLASQATNDTVYRWCMYEYNLLGDPALEMINLTGIQENPDVAVRSLDASVTPAVFNRTTTVRFSLPATGDVELAVFDAGGALVRTLARGRLGAGRHTAVWDGRAETGREAPAGVYLVALRTGQGSTSRKVVRY